MSAHTPGPWSVSQLYASGEIAEDVIFIEPGIAVIERKVAGQDQCDVADARLIAAAPDLLTAAALALDWMRANNALLRDMAPLESAIAKAVVS